ncbi:MAG: hypothetical protein K2Q06_10875 [Parvularculaceae bacterium]|nr:hypothetical protein [Parvularculaceae bacterium]
MILGANPMNLKPVSRQHENLNRSIVIILAALSLPAAPHASPLTTPTYYCGAEHGVVQFGEVEINKSFSFRITDASFRDVSPTNVEQYTLRTSRMDCSTEEFSCVKEVFPEKSLTKEKVPLYVIAVPKILKANITYRADGFGFRTYALHGESSGPREGGLFIDGAKADDGRMRIWMIVDPEVGVTDISFAKLTMFHGFRPETFLDVSCRLVSQRGIFAGLTNKK